MWVAIGDLNALGKLAVPLLEGLLGRMGSDLSCMQPGELCHDRCMVLLLAECMQDIDATRLDAKTRCAGLGLEKLSHNWIFCKIGCSFLDIKLCSVFFLP